MYCKAIVMRKYTQEEILKFASSLERNESDYEWLKNNNCIELAAFRDALVHDNTSALEWLKKTKQEVFVDIYNTLLIDRDYYHFVFESGFKEWAAVISFIQGDDNALNWLVTYNLKHYAILARELSPIIGRRLDASSSINHIARHGF